MRTGREEERNRRNEKIIKGRNERKEKKKEMH